MTKQQIRESFLRSFMYTFTNVKKLHKCEGNFLEDQNENKADFA